MTAVDVHPPSALAGDSPPPVPPAAAESHHLWGGRFTGASSPLLEAINRSIATDYRLWPYDVKLSQAWAVALWNGGVLTLAESRQIERGLSEVGAELLAGAQPVASDEDVHTMIDRMLHERIGDLAARLHTGRSRNDQVATATRLWTLDACARLDVQLRALQQTILERAAVLLDAGALMPAYTHLQRAQPVAAAHWLLAHFWPLDRDRKRLADASVRVATLPLGSGAIAGCAYPISRVLLQGTLGFRTLSENSIDAVSDRDFVAEVIFALALVGTHLSRLAEDLIIFGSSEFGFVEFGDGFTTGSSMMPQKRNPDALELARASAGRLLGEVATILATLKGLPSGYNKDLQEDKRALFGVVDLLLMAMPAVAGTLQEVTFRTDRMRAAISSSMMATDLADLLVRGGATFRDAHASVGRLVRESEESGSELHELAPDRFRAAHALFDDAGVRDALSADSSVARRSVEGGTALPSVRAQLEGARASLRAPAERAGNTIEGNVARRSE